MFLSLVDVLQLVSQLFVVPDIVSQGSIVHLKCVAFPLDILAAVNKDRDVDVDLVVSEHSGHSVTVTVAGGEFLDLLFLELI